MSSSKQSDFEKLSVLGKGSYGVVYKVRRKVDGQTYVMKQIDVSRLSVAEQRAAIVEVQILASLKSDNVVSVAASSIPSQLCCCQCIQLNAATYYPALFMASNSYSFFMASPRYQALCL